MAWRLRFFLVLLATACALASAQPRVIHQRASPYGDLYVTEEAPDLRTLRFRPDGARQSVVDLRDPDHLELAYTRLALAGVAVVSEPRRILLAGLGGGSLPRFLHRNFPEARVEVVEINPQVLEVATQYLGFTRDARLIVHIADARDFIARAPAGAYDLIVLDAFADTTVPPHLATLEFLAAVRHALAPTGVVVSNLWSRAHNKRYDDMLATYRAAFESVATLAVPNEVNVIVLSTARATRLEREALAASAAAVGAARRLRFDLAGMVRDGYFVEAVRGRVLRDRAALPAPQ
jgi:spermidine synthase